MWISPDPGILHLQVTEKQQKGSRRLALNDNVQLLQELQVTQQDSKTTTRQLEAVQAELRDMQTRYKILEARVKGMPAEAGFGGIEADVGTSSPRGSVSMAGRVAPSRPSSAYPAGSPAASGTRASWSAGPSGSRPASASAPSGGGSGAFARPSSSSSYRCDRDSAMSPLLITTEPIRCPVASTSYPRASSALSPLMLNRRPLWLFFSSQGQWWGSTW